MPQSGLGRLWDHRLLIGCSLVLWIAVIGGGVLAYQMGLPAALRARAGMKTRAALDQPRVVTGGGWLVKSVALSDPRIGAVSAIVPRAPSPAATAGLVVAGSEGVVFLEGQSRRDVPFEGCAADVEVILPTTGRPLRFLNRGSPACKTSLLEENGRLLWRYGGGTEASVASAAAADLDGDGGLAVVIGFIAEGGVRRLDASGKEQWAVADQNVWHVEIADIDGSGRPVIVHTNAAGLLVVRDRAGQLVRPPQRMGAYLSYFSLARWPGREEPPLLLIMSPQGLALMRFNGERVKQLSAPLQFGRLQPRGTAVRLESGRPDHFAVVAGWGPWKRSVLWVFTSEGEVAYQEVLPEACAAMAAIPDAASGAEALLVGCQGKLLRYARR